MIPVPRKHINAIIEQPEQFGLTRDEIIATYQAAGEPLGLEGKARSEIMLGLLKQGWVRVRYYPRRDEWQFQVWQCDAPIEKRIADFLTHGLDNGYIQSHSFIRILKTEKQERTASIPLQEFSCFPRFF